MDLSLFSLEGKTALVTGVSRGLGQAMTVALAKAGADIVGVGLRGMGDTRALVEAEGRRAYEIRADLGQRDVAADVAAEAIAAFGRVDILVNNAGITRDNLIVRISEEDFDVVLDTNLKGAFLCCKKAARLMMRQRWGRIVNISSVVGLRGNPGQTNYSASKAGVIGLTKSLAKELSSRNVTVNAVAPGFIDTDMTRVLSEAARTAILSQVPLGTFGQPEDVARTVAFFAGENAGYITGQVLCVDGGMAM